jgi:hypothetical protein
MIDISNVFRPRTTHTLSATTTSGATATSAFGAQTQTVMVTATAGCFVAFDPDRPATTASTYIAAATPYLFRVEGGNMASAITGTSVATVYITELTR